MYEVERKMVERDPFLSARVQEAKDRAERERRARKSVNKGKPNPKVAEARAKVREACYEDIKDIMSDVVPMTANEISEKQGVSKPTIYYHLRNLLKLGEVIEIDSNPKVFLLARENS